MEAGSSDATFDLADYRRVKLTPTQKVWFWALFYGLRYETERNGDWMADFGETG